MDLTAERRKHLAKAVFGLPGERRFPMPDAEHARLAISGASRALHAGTITQAQHDEIVAMANRKLAEG